MERANFGSRLGMILATAGSAVGLGNIWRFPYTTGENGGAAFIVIYLVFILLLGIPGMVAEFVVGRSAQANAARAYRVAGGRLWGVTGYIGIFTATTILGFYSVVAGWCLQYLYASIVGDLSGDPAYVARYFSEYSSEPLRPILWTLLFLLVTHLVVRSGVRKGIEKASKVLMPLLFVILIFLVVASCTLPGASEGIKFLFQPDFSKVTTNTLFEALGQAFFSLSLGCACLVTYSSYFSRKVRLLHSATQVAIIDTLVAILAGMMIFPAAFAVGVQPDSGPSLVFITLPNVFHQAFSAMPLVGHIISILFYALLTLAALTSTISMHEIGTAFVHEELKISRGKGAWVITAVCAVIGVFCSLSMGAVEGLTIGGKDLLDLLNDFTSQILLPLGSMLTCLYVGWRLPKTTVLNEFTNDGTLSARLFPVFLFLIRYLCPISIFVIFIHQLGLI